MAAPPATSSRNSRSIAAICRWRCSMRFAHAPATTVRPHLSLHRRRAGCIRRPRAFFRWTGRRQSHTARPRRDRLRRHQFGDSQAVLSRRRRAALFRHQHVARRNALEADTVRRQHGAGRVDVAWQDGDLSDPRRRRRRTAAHQLGRGNRDAGSTASATGTGRARSTISSARSRTGISTGSTCRPSFAPPTACWNSRWSIRIRCRAGVLTA